MPLPAFREDGWLPEGHWQVGWDEMARAFGGRTGSQRAKLLRRLTEWRDSIREAGMSGRLILDGSFISAKTDPGDLDAIFVFDERTESLLIREPDARDLLNYSRIKESGLGDLFVYAETTARRFPGWCRLDGFDYDTRSGISKGVVEV